MASPLFFLHYCHIPRLECDRLRTGDLAAGQKILPHGAGQLEDNIRVVDLRLPDDDVRLLNTASHPGVPYPKWMVLQLDTAEDPRSKILHPERYEGGGPWKDRRGTRRSG